MDLCQALAAVHGRGLVHRDVKAQNVMREDGGRTVLMDFGAGTELATGLRKPLDMAGTPLYLAPELFDGRPATRASDIYSLGVLLYRMVTREYPVDGADRSADRARASRRTSQAAARRAAGSPERVHPDRSSERCLAGSAARPQTAGELEAALTSKRNPAPAVDRGQRLRLPPRRSCSWPCPWCGSWPNQGKGPGNTQSIAADCRRARTAVPRLPAAVDPSYTVKARLFRTRNGVETPLTSETGLVGGDQLSMQIEASTEVYVYVLNADDAGKVLPAVSTARPPAGQSAQRFEATSAARRRT